MNTQSEVTDRQQAKLDQLAYEGFDASYVVDAERIKVKCSQCQAVAINGIACHETGCPNARHECKGCDELLPLNQKYCAECA
jgi:hypothetical protein